MEATMTAVQQMSGGKVSSLGLPLAALLVAPWAPGGEEWAYYTVVELATKDPDKAKRIVGTNAIGNEVFRFALSPLPVADTAKSLACRVAYTAFTVAVVCHLTRQYTEAQRKMGREAAISDQLPEDSWVNNIPFVSTTTKWQIWGNDHVKAIQQWCSGRGESTWYAWRLGRAVKEVIRAIQWTDQSMISRAEAIPLLYLWGVTQYVEEEQFENVYSWFRGNLRGFEKYEQVVRHLCSQQKEQLSDQKHFTTRMWNWVTTIFSGHQESEETVVTSGEQQCQQLS